MRERKKGRRRDLCIEGGRDKRDRERERGERDRERESERESKILVKSPNPRNKAQTRVDDTKLSLEIIS